MKVGLRISQAKKSERINLGLDIAHSISARGQQWELQEIAALCDCSKNAIHLIELRALKRIKDGLVKLLRKA